MPKRLSSAVPATAVLLTLGAFALPWRRLLQGEPPDPSFVMESGLMTLAAAVALAYLGGVRWRDRERLENAWAVTTRIGSRSLPADRLRAWAGWGLDTLHRERFWGRGLEAAAAGLRGLIAVLAIVSLTGAAACAATLAAGAFVPRPTLELAVAPSWTDALALLLPALLWPAARLHLRRLHSVLPSESEINEAHLALVGRLTDPRLQAGAAAMSAVDHGLDGVFALARSLAPASPHKPDMPGEIAAELMGERT